MSHANQRRFIIEPGGSLSGDIRVPGDKSVSHRAVMLGSVAEGVTRVRGFLEGDDAMATLAAMRALGVRIDGPEAGALTIHGVGLHGLSAPDEPLDLGNSGTSMRLLTGLLCGQRFATTLIGDQSLMTRPMRRVTEPLGQMGADIVTSDKGTAPVGIQPVTSLMGIDYPLPMASAQVKSAVLLAGLYARGETAVTEPGITRDHTERMLQALGYPVEVDGPRVALTGHGRLTGGSIQVPADISSAAFFLVGAAIGAGEAVTLLDVGLNPTRTGVVEILKRMGADLEVIAKGDGAGEPVGDIRIQAASLEGIEIPPSLVPVAIDEFPALFIAAACARGETLLRGAEELRVKESDRIAVMATGLERLGVQVEALPDGIRIVGGRLGGGHVQAKGDHRVAMAFAMAGLVADGPIVIDGCAEVDTSFPGFAGLARSAGLPIAVEEQAG
ncbi:3-phosphoshikimate 1-carboxyvinyltransferase [Spiribacter pallidus]|jgi:3-phosphoshikimate 1-carboxyvinyltransferase|uniref:3-phosphoshikimate 1-carboxyvinyltransferase n=1 Tax=Spiribacter pallidus TaxID=1987936 RepID=A0ABV3TBR6_9GAMM